jgi:hypothetical protein
LGNGLADVFLQRLGGGWVGNSLIEGPLHELKGLESAARVEHRLAGVV